MQARFVAECVSRGSNGAESARAAGYSATGAAQEAYRLVRNPAVQAAIKSEQKRALSAPASKAIIFLASIIDNPEAPWGSRVDAARTVLDRAGLVAPKAGEADDGPVDPKDFDRMTVPELEALLRRLEARNQSESHDDSEPGSKGTDADADAPAQKTPLTLTPEDRANAAALSAAKVA